MPLPGLHHTGQSTFRWTAPAHKWLVAKQCLSCLLPCFTWDGVGWECAGCQQRAAGIPSREAVPGKASQSCLPSIPRNPPSLPGLKCKLDRVYLGTTGPPVCFLSLCGVRHLLIAQIRRSKPKLILSPFSNPRPSSDRHPGFSVHGVAASSYPAHNFWLIPSSPHPVSSQVVLVLPE